MSQSATSIPFSSSLPVPVDAQFDLGQLTGDGGLLWLHEADAALGLSVLLASQIPDWRRRHIHHSLETLVRQRVFQIACGYEDQDNVDTLRADPLLKLACGRLPMGDPVLAGQPTLSRLVNHITRRTCYQLVLALVRLYLQERARSGIPQRILLDLEGTDGPAHGDEEGTDNHGYFGQHSRGLSFARGAAEDVIRC